MSKIWNGRSVLSLRKKFAVQSLAITLVLSSIWLGGLLFLKASQTENYDLDALPDTLNLPEMAPYLASSSVMAGSASGDHFGFSVSYAGDFNNDSIDDVIVGAPYAHNNSTVDVGKAYIFFGGSGGDGNPTTPDVTIIGEVSYANFGHSVAGGGDFDNDSIDDVVVGAPDYDETNPSVYGCGRAYIFLGSNNPPSTLYAVAADFTAQGQGTHDWLGWSVSFAGDFDNNNSDDIIVGAPGWDPNHNYNDRVGRAYLLLSPGTAPLIDVNFSEDITLTFDRDMWFGRSVSYAGNVDDDATGYDDVIIGAPSREIAAVTDGGRAYIFYGEQNPTNKTVLHPSVTTIDGEAHLDDFGYSVSFAGDVDGDGDNDDVIVGAPGYDRGADFSAGRAYIFNGSIPQGSRRLAIFAWVIMTGESSGAHLGNAVSNAGNYNKDNYDDVIVGAYLEDTIGPGGTDAGKAHIFYGGSSMDNKVDVTMVGDTSSTNRYKFAHALSYAGDYDNDTYDDVIVGAPYSESQKGYAHVYNFHDYVSATGMWTYLGGERMGWSVSNAGNFSNDGTGYDDFIVGAPYWNNPATQALHIGQAYIFYGGSSPDGFADVTLTGQGTGDQFGFSVSYAGDFNNDGVDDVIVGAPYADNITNDYVGKAYIFLGGSGGDGNPATADVTIIGEDSSANFGHSVGGGGDFNNDDVDDVIVGAPDYLELPNLYYGKAYIFYGSSSPPSTLYAAAADLDATGDQTFAYLGQSVDFAGDVNNDGEDDVIVGAYGYDIRMSSDVGRAYIYHGGTSPNMVADVVLTGEYAGNKFGYSVSDAGNVNNDNYDDVVVGAPGYNNTNKGRAYIFLGSSSMNNTTADNADVIMTGEANGDQFGFSVSRAGDIENDGNDDVVVGAPNNTAGGTDAGRVYIYHGSSSMNVREDVVMTGRVVGFTGERFGFAVADAGDINNDNYDDVLTGAPCRDSEGGRANVWGDPS